METLNNNLTTNHKQLARGCVLNGRYTIEETLGEGGFGITYRAVHSAMQKSVAIKEFFADDYMYRDIRISKDILLEDTSDQAKLDRDLESFLNEARILAELSNIQGVVHVTDFFRENCTAYIVMDLIEGETLENRIENGGRLTWEEAIRKLIPLMEALSRVHKKRLIHRDIKPDNIIISENEEYILVDFGAALHIRGEETHSIYLTEGYAPKEQYLRTGTLAPYTDVYAICAVLYRCITGQVPENSIKRAVFDELKAPSSLGIQLPMELDSAIMKGLNIEPEDRWQSMDELVDALKATLPKAKKPPNRLIPMLGGVLLAIVAIAFFYTVGNRKEIRLNKMALDGNAVVFRLDAPRGMTTDEFEEAIRITKIRADTFAGNGNYLINEGTSGITLTIPNDCFIENEDWDLDSILEICFSFSGKWLVHNSDMTEFMELTPDNISNLELFYGSVPLVTRSGDPIYYIGNETDWSLKEGYYLKMEFDQTASEFLHEYLSQEGYAFLSSAHRETNSTINIFVWFSQGDGKTAYFYVGSKESKQIAETLYKMMTAESFSNALELTYDDSRDIVWIDPSNDDSFMCSEKELPPLTVDIKCNTETEADQYKAIKLCKKQLALLEIPYSLGRINDNIVARLPIDKTNELMQFSLFGAEMTVKSNWNETIVYSSDIEKAEIANGSSDNDSINVYISEDCDGIHEIENALRESSEPVFLFLDQVRIGELQSIQQGNNCLQFRLYLQEKENSGIPTSRMPEYFCNIASAGELPYLSYDRAVYRDSRKGLISERDVPQISEGVDIGRFSTLYSTVNELGGDVSFNTLMGQETLNIVFDNWAGSFPEEALKMIESIFHETGMANNICDQIEFEIHTWHKGEPVEISATFCVEGKSRSVICTNGSVECNDTLSLESAQKYVEGSEILTPSQDRFVDDNVPVYYDSSWTYRKKYIYKSDG